MANQPKKYKKFVATAATATLVASAIVPVASAASFTDVTDTNSHKDAISNLVDAGIIKGYPDGTFKPDQFVSRGQVVKLLGRWLETEGYEIPTDWNTKQRFNDLPVTNADKELVQYAALAKEAGAFNGANGNLNYSQNMARQQMAIVLVRAIKEIKEVDLVKEYKDAKFTSEISDLGGLNTEQREAITALEYAELTKAATLPGKAFKPNDTITRAQFASFLDRTMKLEVTAPAKAAVKAINSTTVEITFDQEVENVQALNFEIKDLEVKNAAVKQTNKKVVVLTTAPQTADKEYTVSLAGDEIGKFKGISAVNPTKVELVAPAFQGKLGQQVTVKAQVTVAEGQSKAGIPVTFYVPGNNNDGVTPTLTGEAVTDENGVASYSYTRYKDGTDEVTAYATGDRSKFALGYVFWGVDTILSVQEVTTGDTINNGADKTYKVTYKNPKTGLPESNKTFNVGFLENMNVTSDKVKNATVNGVAALQLSNNTGLAAAKITTDSKGEATFTVSGANTAVTPVVFAPNTATGEKAEVYKASALQTTASKVTFGALQAKYTIEMTREGGEVAARYKENGREYKVIVKDKDGKLAKNEIVNVAFNEDLDRVISTNTDAKFIEVDEDDKQTYYPNTAADGKNNAKQISVKTNDKGEAKFVIGSDKENDYATPVAWIDINTSNAKQGRLDEGEPTATAPISYFQNAYLDGASIKAYNANDKAVKEFKGNEIATFRAELVNQSNKKMPNTSIKKVTYTIFNTGANDVKVGNEIVSPNRNLTVTYEGTNPELKVVAVDGKSTSVKVTANGIALNTDNKDYAFTSKEATATFTSLSDVGNQSTGDVVEINDKYIVIKGKDPIELKDVKFFNLYGTEIHGVSTFVDIIKAYNTGVQVTYTEDKDGKKSIRIYKESSASGEVNTTSALKLTDAQITKKAEGSVTTTAATASVIVDREDVTINGKTYKYSANAFGTDKDLYKSVEDLVAKINEDTAVKGVKASVKDLANKEITLTGKDTDSFTYKVGNAPERTANGKKDADAVKQQITFTFSAAVNVKSGDLLQVTTGSTATVKVVSVSNTSVVVELENEIVAGTTITGIKLNNGSSIKSKLTDKEVNPSASIKVEPIK
ncbi:S-layer homology domain-containing protein [Lysinibacillus sp. CNPSo 3705]|uniref:S-layer homology domain-containing protein n=1 Tax=Lysinibacillus sp. CNPSo 3705 TaxID=3028148 RepID=UPI0023638E85|nr:S-layer homology domain-containing protein [Lysinibacillus sp. CNPSo 3705]MDD1503240.1 S-layer homology domain-containing protein [Lysinibacillus sp. CNPSo 3705]